MQLRLSLCTAALALAVLAPMSAQFATAQSGASSAPQAPTQQAPPKASAPKRTSSSAIGTLSASSNPKEIFPKPDPRNFTADTPTAAAVNAFLQQSWGYDPQRIWQVQAIQKTAVDGVSKVIVLVAQKPPSPGATTPAETPKPQVASLQFFTLPDGKHLVADDVLPFGPTPFLENRRILQQRAEGPAKGAASKDLLLVEFADYQCPHCKDAQATIDKLVQQFPNARFVYQNFPLVQIHSEAYKASAYSVCVAKIGGNDAFFKFSAAVYGAQASLTPEGSDQALKDAVSKVGLDPAKVTACSTSAEAKSAVDASLKLGQEVGINQTPMLVVNGRVLPLSSLPVEALGQIVAFQAAQDGATTSAAK